MSLVSIYKLGLVGSAVVSQGSAGTVHQLRQRPDGKLEGMEQAREKRRSRRTVVITAVCVVNLALSCHCGQN
jgi:hypothetical protein